MEAEAVEKEVGSAACTTAGWMTATMRSLEDLQEDGGQGVTKKCRLSWLTNGALVCEPKCAGGGSCGDPANEYSCTQEPKKTLEI